MSDSRMSREPLKVPRLSIRVDTVDDAIAAFNQQCADMDRVFMTNVLLAVERGDIAADADDVAAFVEQERDELESERERVRAQICELYGVTR
jgi:hypothetical protein